MTFEIVYLQLEMYVGRSMQENLNSVVTDGKLNNAIAPYALDTKDKHILAVQNPLQVTFKDVKKFGPQYPIIGKLLTQIESSKLTEKRIRDQLGQIKDREIETRLLNLRSNNNNSNNSNNNNNDVGRRLTEHRPPPPPPPFLLIRLQISLIQIPLIHFLVRQLHHTCHRYLEMNLQYCHILVMCLLHQTTTLSLQKK